MAAVVGIACAKVDDVAVRRNIAQDWTFERANRNGGVHAHKLRLIALDDAYEPVRTGSNMLRLIETDNVLAVIGNVGTPTAAVAVPLANDQKTLLFGAFSGASCENTPLHVSA